LSAHRGFSPTFAGKTRTGTGRRRTQAPAASPRSGWLPARRRTENYGFSCNRASTRLERPCDGQPGPPITSSRIMPVPADEKGGGQGIYWHTGGPTSPFVFEQEWIGMAKVPRKILHGAGRILIGGINSQHIPNPAPDSFGTPAGWPAFRPGRRTPRKARNKDNDLSPVIGNGHGLAILVSSK